MPTIKARKLNKSTRSRAWFPNAIYRNLCWNGSIIPERMFLKSIVIKHVLSCLLSMNNTTNIDQNNKNSRHFWHCINLPFISSKGTPLAEGGLLKQRKGASSLYTSSTIYFTYNSLSTIPRKLFIRSSLH